MTSLARQLAKLAVPSSASFLLQDKRRVSFLFDPREAANLDRETFYSIGINGLHELTNIDSEFGEYEKTLFNETSTGFERSVQTKEVNDKLDNAIHSFLIHLSPYFQLRPAHKALEWLIYRFHIHKYNVDDLMMCVLPHHCTKSFVRALQTLKLSDPHSRWNWLEPLQKPGVPLPRSSVMNHAYKDPGFLNFICEMIPNYLEVHSDQSVLQVLFSFYSSTIVGSLEYCGQVTEGIVSALIPYMTKGLRSKCPQYKLSTYMILGQLVTKVQLKHDLLFSLMKTLTKKMVSKHSSEAVMCIVLVYQYQNLTNILKKTFKYLCKVPGLVQILAKMAECHNMQSFFKPFLLSLIPVAVKDTETMTTSSDAGEDLLSGTPPYGCLFECLLQDVVFEEDLAKLVIDMLYKEYKTCKECIAASPESLNERMKTWIRLLERRYPKLMDAHLCKTIAAIKTDQDSQVLKDVMSFMMSAVKHEVLPDSTTSLVLGLSHPQAAIRQMAVKQLIDKIKTGSLERDGKFFQESLIQRLNDDCPSVVLSVLELQDNLLQVIPADNVYCLLNDILIRTRHNHDWLLVHKSALELLCLDSFVGSLYSRDEDDVLMAVLPFTLIFNNDIDSTLAFVVMNSDFGRDNPLLKAHAPEWTNEVKKNKRVDHNQVNSTLITAIAKTLITLPLQKVDSIRTKLLVSMETLLDETLQYIILSVVSECLVFLSRDNSANKILFLTMFMDLVKNMLLQQDLPLDRSTTLTLSGCLKLFDQSCGLSDTIQSLSRGQGIPMFALIGQIHRLVSSLTLPVSMADKFWWNLKDNLYGKELQFLVEMCDLLLAWSQMSTSTVFKELFVVLLQQCFPTFVGLMKFLSMVWSHWSHSDSTNDSGDLQIYPTLQLKFLKIATLKIDSANSIGEDDCRIISDYVIPSLMCPILSPHSELRCAALEVFKAISMISQPSMKSSLVKKIVSNRHELLNDGSHIKHIMNVLYSKLAVPLDTTGMTPKKAKKRAAKLAQLNSELYGIVGTLGHAQMPVCVQSSLLSVLQLVQNEKLVMTLVSQLDKLLTSETCLTAEGKILLELIITKFTPLVVVCLENKDVLSCFTKAMIVKHTQVLVLEQVTKEFFSALSDNVKHQILSLLFDILSEAKVPEIATAVNKTLKHIALSAELIQNELALFNKQQDAKTVRQAKRTRSSARFGSQSGSVFNEQELRKLTRILETIENKKKIKESHRLLPCLFSLISKCLEDDNQERMEYLKQLLMSCILNICNRLERLENLGDGMPEKEFNVEMIVQCVRSSDNPQTQHQALLLLTVAAKLFPDHVLHHIMSVFTFMGDNMMRQDDMYTFQIMSKTIETVIPALLAARDSDRDNLPEGSQDKLNAIVIGILRVFSDAYPHIPTHRRLPLFTKLLTTVDSKKYMWMMVVVLIQKHVTRPQPDDDTGVKTSIPADIEFCMSICHQIGTSDQAKCMKQILVYMAQLPNDKPEISSPAKKQRTTRRTTKSAQEANTNDEGPLLNLSVFTAKQFRHFKFSLISFLGFHLSSQTFIEQVSDQEDMLNDPVQFQELLEAVLKYINRVAKIMAKTAENTAKFWKALLHKSYEVLDKVTSLLPGNAFISVVSGLMSNDVHTVRRKALDLFNAKLQHQREPFSTTEEIRLIEMIDKLETVAMVTKSDQESDEYAVNRQTALLGLKLLCKQLGELHPHRFRSLLSNVVNLLRTSTSNPVTASALLCLAELVTTLHAHTISHLSTFMPTLLTILQNKKKLLSNDILLLSAVTTVHKVVESLPAFISPYLHDIIVQVVILSTSCLDDTDSKVKVKVKVVNQKSQLVLRLKAVRHLIAKLTPPRVLIPILIDCYQQLQENQKLCIVPLMLITQDHIANMSSDDLKYHNSSLVHLFMEALEYRSSHANESLSSIVDIEDHVINTVVSMVLKLSEQVFRPIFFKFYDWASRSSAHKERMITFYRLANCLAQKLKSLFTLFAGHLVKNAAHILDANNATKSEVPFFGDTVNYIEKSDLLLDSTIDCLLHCFLHDSDGFLTKERFNELMPPLVDQLENYQPSEDGDRSVDEVFEKRTTNLLVPCICQMAVAIGDDSQWKPLNYQVLLKTKHASAKVRFAALTVVEAFNKTLGEDYMSLLPETIPFLAELLEDESFEVEQQCQEVIHQMEKVLGHPLNKYF